jgi:NADH-quinone oxidoreductase subunit C
MMIDIKKSFPFIEEVAVQNGDAWFIVPSDKIVEVCKTLRDQHRFDCLSCLTGSDRGDFFEVVYHIFSYASKEKLVLKVKLEKENLNLPSIADVWPAANWMEREAYDLFGIQFTGHPNLTRLLLPEDWIGHPMRKDYKEPAEYQGMSTTREGI